MSDVHRDDLWRWWNATFTPAKADVFDDLLARWSSPSRHYHNVEHLHECLRELNAASGDLGAIDPRPVAVALWFHDAIYEPSRGDNEAASADLAAVTLREQGEHPATINRVRQLILDTAHRAQPHTPDGRLIVDIDLSILGKPPARFDRYDAAIRAEYAHVPWPDYRAGRRKVLQAFLDRPAIYHAPRFQTLYEAAARANLQRAMARLESAADCPD
jgi:predicted metal-dependent HD superfamily phosphohydrolase